MSPVSRGFHGRQPEVDAARVPPGQHVVKDFPVLSAGPTPRAPLDEWSFTIHGAVDEPVSWPWEEFVTLPSETFTVDIHCVTKWSKLDTTWTGVSVDTLLDGVRTEAPTSTCGATATTRPTFRSPISPADGRGSSIGTTTSRSRPSTVARHDYSSRISTSGRARSGCAGSSSATATSRGSGRATATTTTATPGGNSDMRATDQPQPARVRGRPASVERDLSARTPQTPVRSGSLDPDHRRQISRPCRPAPTAPAGLIASWRQPAAAPVMPAGAGAVVTCCKEPSTPTR